jgi:hypothetical protein
MPDIAASLTDAVLTKRCSTCREQLPLAMFYKKKGCPGNLSSQCKACCDNSRRAYEQRNPVLAQTRCMTSAAKSRAIQKNLDFDIDREHVRSLVVTHCPILGIALEWARWNGSGSCVVPGSPSLDRIDPSRGYVKGNVWIISHKANSIKSNATHEELKLVTKAVGEAIVRSLEF